jgi:hypothetical protein
VTKDEAARILALYLQDHPLKSEYYYEYGDGSGNTREGHTPNIPPEVYRAFKEELEGVLLEEWEIKMQNLDESWIISYPDLRDCSRCAEMPAYRQPVELLRYGVFCIRSLEPRK